MFAQFYISEFAIATHAWCQCFKRTQVAFFNELVALSDESDPFILIYKTAKKP